MNEQSYIIRIYRSAIRPGFSRRNHDAVTLDGIVESPASGEHIAFHDVEELWTILARNVLHEGRIKRTSKPRNKR
jgi:hypothetical protein